VVSSLEKKMPETLFIKNIYEYEKLFSMNNFMSRESNKGRTP